MNWIIDNWSLIVTILAVLVYFFLNGRKSVISFLLYAVTLAEKEFGEKTGRLKLSMVYEMFVSKYPIFSKILPFSVFSAWVDVVLQEMRKILEDNINAKRYVEGEK